MEIKSKGLPNQYLGLVGTIGDVVLSKPIKPMNVLFKGKSVIWQEYYSKRGNSKHLYCL